MVAKYSEWTRGQDEALLNKLGGMEVALRLLTCNDVTVEFTDGGAAAVVTGKKPAARQRQGILAPGDRSSLPACDTPPDPHEFFQIRIGLWVSDWFRDRIRSVAKAVKSLRALEIASFDLVKDASDSQIQSELGDGGYIFEDTSVFVAHLAGLISRQEGGKSGPLLNNGYANIFYVVGVGGRVFSIGVGWRAGYREWRVHACRLDAHHWHAGRRVFSATAT